MLKITDESKQLSDDIVHVKMKLALAERKLERLANAYRPTAIMGIDYANPNGNGCYQPIDIEELAVSIFMVRDEIEQLKVQLKKLKLKQAHANPVAIKRSLGRR
ncbi:hypothetical protein KHM83_14300 [Fusibacter paucivorans]|uniref:Uncharacterized protein n=1 Tax=Fusibacter paucivorans TaxID=76009 RepID=A0ABS5PUX1_9FIRM|nr:hypothetical protein [Fusibacter paucivorans]MBS7527852.1 hypothetical protein [Fusibacter paucivorans]